MLSSTTLAPQTVTVSSVDDFPDPQTYQIVTFLTLFTVSFMFTIALFVINLYKSLKIATEQKLLLRQASTSMRRDSATPDLILNIGVPISNLKKASTAPTASDLTPKARVTAEKKKQ